MGLSLTRAPLRRDQMPKRMTAFTQSSHLPGRWQSPTQVERRAAIEQFPKPAFAVVLHRQDRADCGCSGWERINRGRGAWPLRRGKRAG